MTKNLLFLWGGMKLLIEIIVAFLTYVKNEFKKWISKFYKPQKPLEVKGYIKNDKIILMADNLKYFKSVKHNNQELIHTAKVENNCLILDNPDTTLSMLPITYTYRHSTKTKYLIRE